MEFILLTAEMQDYWARATFDDMQWKFNKFQGYVWFSGCSLCIRLFDDLNIIKHQTGYDHIDWSVQKRRYSSALAVELRLYCINPSSIYFLTTVTQQKKIELLFTAIVFDIFVYWCLPKKPYLSHPLHPMHAKAIAETRLYNIPLTV